MSTYRAVVKMSMDATQAQKERVLREGLELIAAELVDDHDYSVEMIEEALEDAHSFAEEEYEAKKRREAEGDA